MEKLRSFLRSPRGRAFFIVSCVLTAGICLVMNLWLLPSIEATTDGIRCFDMNFGYDYATAQRFLSLLSPEGRATYLHVQLPLDFVYPLAYGCCFCGLFFYLTGRFSALQLLPLLLMGFDYAENICTILMLRAASLSPALAAAASALTVIKTLLLYVNAALLLLCAVRFFLQKRRARADGSAGQTQ
ncbi:MAG: hypothetical protein IK080_01375 [Clostridia bacterium]|nr:hypothetical protein [Clostridia bacterium]